MSIEQSWARAKTLAELSGCTVAQARTYFATHPEKVELMDSDPGVVVEEVSGSNFLEEFTIEGQSIPVLKDCLELVRKHGIHASVMGIGLLLDADFLVGNSA